MRNTISIPFLWYLVYISQFHLIGIRPHDNFLTFLRRWGRSYRLLLQMLKSSFRNSLSRWLKYISQPEHLPACQRAVADPSFHCSKIHRGRSRSLFFSNIICQNQGLKSLTKTVNGGGDPTVSTYTWQHHIYQYITRERKGEWMWEDPACGLFCCSSAKWPVFLQ